MIGHPIMGDPRYTYGYMAQRERWLADQGSETAAKLADEVERDVNAISPSSQESTAEIAESRKGDATVSSGNQAREEANRVSDLQRRLDGADLLHEELRAESVGVAGGPRLAPGIDSSERVESGESREHPLDCDLCLWAVEVNLIHPVTQTELNVQLDEPPLYCELRNRHQADWSRK